ncbi:MAG: hypothetical protein FWE90_10105 [Defluviitaleaceae bacterium]|nr:hypothetical protein [Defluviitaleaceae bacterium]
MKLKTGISYNMDMLCLLNTLTADSYYTDRHKEVFDAWYPQLSEEIKTKMRELADKQENSMLSPTVTLFVSSLDDFNNRNLAEMLGSFDEIEKSMNKTPYAFDKEEFEEQFSRFKHTIIPLISELEEKGFRQYWEQNWLPKIREKCAEINDRLAAFNIDEALQPFGDIDNSDCTIYLCAFTDPLGIKLCGNNLLTDIRYSLDIILSNATHEMFHPPYNREQVRDHITALFDNPWVKEAFDNQSPNSGYGTAEGFIEENIVEALGIYLAVKLGADIEPYEYFKNHDGGSHVVSPHFYKYLCENKKERSQPFESYFIEFIASLNQRG